MTNLPPTIPGPELHSAVSIGDTFARDGHWQAAVARWVDGYAEGPTVERSARAQRVRWMIQQGGTSIGAHNSEQGHRRGAYRILLVVIAFATIATTMIVVGTFAKDGTVPWLAAGGWIGIVASVTCAIVFVLRLNRAGVDRVNAPLSDDEIARALELAETIDRESAILDHPHGDPAG